MSSRIPPPRQNPWPELICVGLMAAEGDVRQETPKARAAGSLAARLRGRKQTDDRKEADRKDRDAGVVDAEMAVESVAARRAVSSWRGPLNDRPGWRAIFARPLAVKELSALTRQMSIMVEAGLPLTMSIYTLIEQCGKRRRQRRLRKILEKVVESIEGGSPMSVALQQFPRSFSELYVNMVRAGEATGRLDEMLARLADYIERSEQLRRKVKGALIYPTIVLVVSIGVTALLMIFIVPKFRDVFTEMLAGEPLPALTQTVMQMSDWLLHNFLQAIGWLVGFGLALKAVRMTRIGQLVTDFMAIHVPPFSSLVLKTSTARFCSTLGTLLEAGVPILSALEIAGDVTPNEMMRRTIERVRKSVAGGEAIAAPLDASQLFPKMVVRMVAVGEQTGKLPDMLIRLAKVYEQEVDAAIESAVALIEPAMIVFLAVAVGGLVISLLLPLIKLIETLGS